MVLYLEKTGCESYTNGLSWYVLYYIDSHLMSAAPPEAAGYKVIGRILQKIQNRMIDAVKNAGFFSLPPLDVLKKEVSGKVSFAAAIGDGWLIGA